MKNCNEVFYLFLPASYQSYFIFLLCVVFPQQHNIFVHCIVYWKTRKLSVVWKNKQTKKYTQSLWDPRIPLTSTTTTKKLKQLCFCSLKHLSHF